jgi:hypothetical protein
MLYQKGHSLTVAGAVELRAKRYVVDLELLSEGSGHIFYLVSDLFLLDRDRNPGRRGSALERLPIGPGLSPEKYQMSVATAAPLRHSVTAAVPQVQTFL